MLRALRVFIASAVVAATIVVTSGTAHADPTPTYCSSWKPAGWYQVRTCIAKHPGSMEHIYQVQNLDWNYHAPQVMAFSVINGAWSLYFMTSGLPLSGGEFWEINWWSTRSCSSNYATVGYVEYNGWNYEAASPTISGC